VFTQLCLQLYFAACYPATLGIKLDSQLVASLSLLHDCFMKFSHAFAFHSFACFTALTITNGNLTKQYLELVCRARSFMETGEASDRALLQSLLSRVAALEVALVEHRTYLENSLLALFHGVAEDARSDCVALRQELHSGLLQLREDTLEGLTTIHERIDIIYQQELSAFRTDILVLQRRALNLEGQPESTDSHSSLDSLD